MRMKIKNGKGVLNLFLIWFIVAFIIYPNLNLLKTTFFINGELSLNSANKLLSSKIALKSLMNSFILAVSLSLTVNIVGIFVVLVTEFYKVKGTKILKLGYFTTLIYGGIMVASGYKFIYGENSFITHGLQSIFPNISSNWFEGYGAVLFTMTFACTTNHLIFLTNSIRNVDYQIIEAAKNMGANEKTVLFKILLPTLKPVLYALTILTFLTGLSAVSAPLILGGKGFQTINPMIIMFSKTHYSRDIATLLSLILGGATILLVVFMNRIENGKNYISISKTKTKLKKQSIENKIVNISVHVISYLLFLIYMFPIVMVILFSLTEGHAVVSGKISLATFTLDNYTKLFTQMTSFKPYLVSSTYSGLAAIGVVIYSLTIAKLIHKKNDKLAKFYEYSSLIPWLLPATLIALGMMITYDSPRPILLGQVLIGSPIIMVLAYIIVKIPFSFRMLRAAFFSIDDSLEEAAKTMGASTFYTFRKVIFPILLPSTMAIGAIVFNSLLTDYDLSVFLYHPLLEPLGVVIMKSTDIEADLNAKAMVYVYSVTLMIISGIIVYYTYGRERKAPK